MSQTLNEANLMDKLIIGCSTIYGGTPSEFEIAFNTWYERTHHWFAKLHWLEMIRDELAAGGCLPWSEDGEQ